MERVHGTTEVDVGVNEGGSELEGLVGGDVLLLLLLLFFGGRRRGVLLILLLLISRTLLLLIFLLLIRRNRELGGLGTCLRRRESGRRSILLFLDMIGSRGTDCGVTPGSLVRLIVRGRCSCGGGEEERIIIIHSLLLA